MIDIILCCYNQEQYIAKALSSILEQVTNDKIHLIVADDASSDNTLQIIKDTLRTSNAFDVEILPSDRNVGMARNYQRAFAHCRGEYALILEGDDWWISAHHIQSHVQFLKEHREVSMCASTMMMYNQNTCGYTASSWGGVMLYNIHYQVVNNCLGNLSACCFKVELLKALPESVFDLSIADYFLGIFMAQYGEIALLPEPTSVWRTGVGQWSSKKLRENRADIMQEIDRYDAFFSYRYHDDFRKAKVRFSPHLNLTWKDFVPKAAVRIIKYIIGRL